MDDHLVNTTKKVVDESEFSIGVANGMVNPAIEIFDVSFDEEELANDEPLHMMQ